MKGSKGSENVSLSYWESKHGTHWVDRSKNQHKEVQRKEGIFYGNIFKGKTHLR